MFSETISFLKSEGKKFPVISFINTQNNQFSFQPPLLEILPHTKLKCAKLVIL